MAHLKVRLRGQLVAEIDLHEGKTYLAGRKEDCDIVLPADTGISREHFQISFESSAWKLSVISKFGFILSNGEKLQILDLTGLLVFSVPPYEFEFDPAHAVVAVKAAPKNELALQSQVSAAAPTPVAISDNFDEERTYVGQLAAVPILKMLNAAGDVTGNIRLDNGNFFLAGRESNCQIHIQDQRVSRKQFEIHRSGEEFTLIDPGSVNGTQINGQTVPPHTQVILKSGDTIAVLDNSMVFEMHDPNFQQMMDQARSLILVEDQYTSAQTMSPYGGGAQEIYDPHMYAPAAKKFDIHNFNIKDFDFKKHKARLIMGVGALVLILVAAFSGGESQEVQNKNAALKANDPLAKLTQEQKTMTKHHYQLAENYLAQQKWSLAKSEIDKIKELLPENYRLYERTKDLENNAEQGMLNEQEIEKLEAQQQQQKLLQEKITAKVAECRKLITPNVSKEEVEACLQPALQLSPDDPQVKGLQSMVDQIVTERVMLSERKKDGDRQAAQLRSLFQKAEREEKADDLVSAINTYQQVLRSSLPDRESLKFKAQRQANTLKGQMSSKTVRYIAEANKSVQDQQYKTAIVTLRKAKKIDPNNPEIDEKIDNYVRELKKQMLVIFQEGILEEGFGNIEGSEGKPGAKDKWKKVLELDVPDGEYYQKAKARLKKYGVT